MNAGHEDDAAFYILLSALCSKGLLLDYHLLHFSSSPILFSVSDRCSYDFFGMVLTLRLINKWGRKDMSIFCLLVFFCLLRKKSVSASFFLFVRLDKKGKATTSIIICVQRQS